MSVGRFHRLKQRILLTKRDGRSARLSRVTKAVNSLLLSHVSGFDSETTAHGERALKQFDENCRCGGRSRTAETQPMADTLKADGRPLHKGTQPPRLMFRAKGARAAYARPEGEQKIRSVLGFLRRFAPLRSVSPIARGFFAPHD